MSTLGVFSLCTVRNTDFEGVSQFLYVLGVLIFCNALSHNKHLKAVML
jgi:hypothetical protein